MRTPRPITLQPLSPENEEACRALKVADSQVDNLP